MTGWRALEINTADPPAAARFWAELLGWPVAHRSADFAGLRTPDGRGPWLEFVRDAAPSGPSRLRPAGVPASRRPGPSSGRTAPIRRATSSSCCQTRADPPFPVRQRARKVALLRSGTRVGGYRKLIPWLGLLTRAQHGRSGSATTGRDRRGHGRA
ncbi:VOC family protein [Amycolatopsis arida]|uniref:VOC family protein n=1 Tax=Amycolatopsis arida TaxID=587909 RepID=UPI001416FEC1|nr:VOC family protein [Amycolatopsis arida]